MSKRHKPGKQDDSFRPETGFESESSVSDKAFLQANAVNPIANDSKRAGREEFAAEVAAPFSRAMTQRKRTKKGKPARERYVPKTSLGYAAILIAVISFFWMPSILGPASVVVGFMAFVRGSRALGIWSMLLGTIAFVIFLTTIPYNY